MDDAFLLRVLGARLHLDRGAPGPGFDQAESEMPVDRRAIEVHAVPPLGVARYNDGRCLASPETPYRGDRRMAWCPHRSLALCFAVLAPAWMAGISHAYDIPNQVMQSFTFELHSVDDDIDLYIGDPQSLFLMYVRPQGSLRPNLEFSNTAQVGLLRVRDLSLFEEPPLPEDLSEEDAELMEEPEKRVVAQEWRMELAPSAPALVVLHCVRGKARYDFTGIDVREAYLQADTAQVRVGTSTAPIASPWSGSR